ncbi:MAG: hypothetical protein HDKAJFGB_00948 [Anaerolineae bacterium]|nr:hypothetical protein [Anaerolineae bacterium]
MDLGSLLGGLSGEESQGQGGTGQGDAMADMLGALLGGQGGAPVSDGDQVLGSLSGASGPGMNNPAAGGPDLGGLLGALMGGGGAQGGAQGGDLGGLLGGLLGGQAGQSNDPVMGMLGGLLGGMGGASPNAGAMGGANTGMNAALAPLADMLSEKLGLPREVAMTAMAIIVPMILSKLAGGGQTRGGDPLGGAERSQGMSFSPDEQNEMIQSLTAQTGMNEEQAAQVLNQAVQVLGSQ